MQQLYGIRKHNYSEENPVMPLDYDEFELALKTTVFLGLTYSVKTDVISVTDENSGMITDLTVQHFIDIY